jgi:hypothetical protein
VYFVRVNPKGVSEKSLDTDIAVGDIHGPGALDAFRALVSDLYLPILQVRGDSWPEVGVVRMKAVDLGGAHESCEYRRHRCV